MNQDEAGRERRPSLSRREERVHQELHRLDPRLAGLFLDGIEYLQRLDKPGSIHMLSHAGREISNAVIRILTGEGEPLSPQEEEESPAAGSQRELDSQRRRIAGVLDLPEQHPSVTAWVKAHNALQRTTHFGSRPPSPEAVDETVRAFRALTDILVGRIGLYFEAREEIEALLQVEDPTDEQVQRLQALAARPQLRTAFFRDLRHVGWLRPLTEAGFFADPPGVHTDPDTGQVTAPPWPEAAYLEKVAQGATEQVVVVLENIPNEISNPVVWRGVTDITLHLPPEHAARLVPKLQNALAQSTHPMVTRGVFTVAEMLAAADEGGSLALLRALLRIEPSDDSGLLATSHTGQTADLPAMAHTARPEAFLSLVESIARVRAKATVATLCAVLNDMLVVEFGEPPRGVSVVLDHSRHWHGHIEDEDDRSTKSLVTAAILRASLVAAASDEAGDAYVLQRLAKYQWQVFHRLRLALLAQRPVFDQEALDACIGNADLLNEPYLLPEYRELLQAHLSDASPAVRASVIDGILRGPDENTVQNVAGEDPEVAKGFRENWQRHRLRVFGDDPPTELRELSKELGTIGETLSKWDRDMDRYGFAIEVGVGGGPTSPLSIEDVGRMKAEELIDYLTTWKPEPGRHAPTPAGLANVIAGRVQDDPEWAATFLNESRDADVDPTYLRGAIDGISAALKAGKPLPWADALDFIEWLSARPPEPEAGSPAQYFDNRDPGLEWARNLAADFLSDAAQGESVPSEHRDRLWKAVEAMIRAEATWIGADEVPTTMESVLNLDLNDLGGRAARALLQVALYDYRAGKREDPESADWPHRDRLRPLLETVLKQRGEAAIAARSAIGRLLPQLMLIDPEWTDANREKLFEGAIKAPFENPTFATYIVRAGVYGQTFEHLRPLYQEAVAATEESANIWTSGPEDFRPGRHLLWHLVVAYIHSWLEIEADAALLDTAFTNSDPEDSAHVWWRIFRDWSDADQVDPAVIERITVLLNWRVTRLEEEGRDRKRVREEAKGLAWIAMADRVPDNAMLPLLLRAARLSNGEVPIAGMLWERLGRMAAVDVGQAIQTAVLVIEAELRGDYPHFNFDEVAPVLRIGLGSHDLATRKLTERTIHTLGDHGFEQFGSLLSEL